jgi:hypothetical protein
MDQLDRMYANHILSAESIRQHVDDYTLFCYYMDMEPSINVPVQSPLRDDLRPSFTLYYNTRDKLKFCDHGTGRIGDVFDFISAKYGINHTQALQQVNHDFGLGYDGAPSVDVKYAPQKEPVIRPKKKLEITSREFTSKALDWWNSFGITREILDRYYVTQVDWLHWDGNPAKAGDMTFAYRIGKFYKIYRPLSVGLNKFMNTYPRHYVEGLLQLQQRLDYLIITKSLKDVMVLSRLGYEAIAPKSESTSITTEIRDFINQRYKRIVVLFDDDEGGRRGTESYPEYEKIYIPGEDKDISDFTRKNGLSEAGQLIHKLLSQ